MMTNSNLQFERVHGQLFPPTPASLTAGSGPDGHRHGSLREHRAHRLPADSRYRPASWGPRAWSKKDFPDRGRRPPPRKPGIIFLVQTSKPGPAPESGKASYVTPAPPKLFAFPGRGNATGGRLAYETFRNWPFCVGGGRRDLRRRPRGFPQVRSSLLSLPTRRWPRSAGGTAQVPGAGRRPTDLPRDERSSTPDADRGQVEVARGLHSPRPTYSDPVQIVGKILRGAHGEGRPGLPGRRTSRARTRACVSRPPWPKASERSTWLCRTR